MRFKALLGFLGCMSVLGAEPAPPASSPPIEWAEIEPLAAQSLLLGLAAAGPRLIVVGERGHVLLSDDHGHTWRQAAQVPTRVLLTAVCFADERHGIAVGHDETIIASADAGEHWSLAHRAPEALRPLLDVWCGTAGRAIAVGAYMSYFTSADYGATWTARKFQPAAPPMAATPPAGAKARDDGGADEGLDYHLNRIVGTRGGRFYIAAEGGHLYRSDDDAVSWITLPSPYSGSFFGVLPLQGEAVLAFGLRGHVYRSADAGAHWLAAASGTVALLDDAVPFDGGVALVGLSGAVLTSHDGGATLVLHQQKDRKGLSAALEVSPGELVVVGEGGARLLGVAAP